MSLSVLIRCPQCSAEGELADAALFGQAISCPLCQHIFVAPVPDGFGTSVPTTSTIPDAPTSIAVESMPGVPATAVETLIPVAIAVDVPPVAVPVATLLTDVPVVEATVVAEAAQPIVVALPVQAPLVAAPIGAPLVSTPPAANSVSGDFLVPERPPMEGPLPSFMAASPLHGPAEIAFAQSLPEPAARGSVKGPKLQSKTVQIVVAGTITAILLFATVMFLMGDPLRGKKPKLDPVENANSPAITEEAQDESIEDVFKRIQSSSKSENQ